MIFLDTSGMKINLCHDSICTDIKIYLLSKSKSSNSTRPVYCPFGADEYMYTWSTNREGRELGRHLILFWKLFLSLIHTCDRSRSWDGRGDRRNLNVLVWTMRMETETLVSGCLTEAEREGLDCSLFFRSSSASVELSPQTSKCEPVMTEVQAEMEG